YARTHSLADEGDLIVSAQSCALVVPARAGLVAAAPVQPVPGGPGRWWVGEQAPGFWDGERDHAGVGRRGLIWPHWRWCLSAGAVAQEGGGDGADGQGGHDQHGVPGDRGVEADLGLVQPEAALAELEVLLDGLITNGKFCCVRRLRLALTWWHRPLRLRGSALQSDVALVGEPDDPDMDRIAPAQPASRRRAPVGSGLPAAGALGQAGRSAGPGADRRGGT